MKKFKKWNPSALTRITILLSVMGLVIWGVCMYFYTDFIAYEAVKKNEKRYTRSLADIFSRYYEDLTENEEVCSMWSSLSEEEQIKLFWNGMSDEACLDGEIAIYDPEGNPLASSWGEYRYFSYWTQEQWDKDKNKNGDVARIPLELEKEHRTKSGKKYFSKIGTKYEEKWIWATKIIGIMDGQEMIPRKIECIPYSEQRKAFLRIGGEYSMAKTVELAQLSWTTIYEDTTLEPSDKEVSIYTDGMGFYNEKKGNQSFRYKNSRYESEGEWLQHYGPICNPDWEYTVARSVSGKKEQLLVNTVYCYENKEETYFLDGPQTGGKLQFYAVFAVCCQPWEEAMAVLIPDYVITFFVMALVILIIRFVIKQNLINLLGAMNKAFINGGDSLSIPRKGWKWQEAKELEKHFRENRDELKRRENEIIRLNTAMEYVSNAETNRRQLVSNITHELKTPLAIIHSYVEGLQENIAEEKRDKYLDVILSETERMDAMVLEMLDLSRLEAGKVKLARDEFSLIDLAKSIFEKLEMAMEVKSLELEYAVPEECVITADEARLSQVIENFATNAIKYSPIGGKIQVRIIKGKTTIFSVENEGESLSQDAISHVWDTFYRVDESRSTQGTGLGLAIAKNIIELHGGSCSVWNSKTGIVFSFTL